MFNDILLGIAGIEVYPVVSLILFVAVFGVVVLRVARMDRTNVQRMAALPLDLPDAAGEAEGTVLR
jgi:hypothetical protein